MKKIICILTVSILLLTMPAVYSFQLDLTKYNTQSSPEDAPAWAIGNFTGKWAYDLFELNSRVISVSQLSQRNLSENRDVRVNTQFVAGRHESPPIWFPPSLSEVEKKTVSRVQHV